MTIPSKPNHADNLPRLSRISGQIDWIDLNRLVVSFLLVVGLSIFSILLLRRLAVVIDMDQAALIPFLIFCELNVWLAEFDYSRNATDLHRLSHAG